MQDTYLSPEKFSGTELRFLSQSFKHNASSTLAHSITHEAYLSQGLPARGSGSTISAAYHFQYALLTSILSGAGSSSPSPREGPACWGRLGISRGGVSFGFYCDFLGGAFYNTRNGNNPAQMRTALNIGPMVRAQCRLRNIGITYEASCPLVGLTFSPNYGQSYYEIFDQHNFDHNIVPTTIISTPSLRNQLFVTFPLSAKSKASVGYIGDYRQQQVNNLKQHSYSSLFMIGLSRSLTR